MRRVVAYALVVVLLLTGCDSPDEPESAPSWQALAVDAGSQALVDRLRGMPFRAANIDVVTGVLRAAGVGVYRDDAVDGAEPVRLTSWQVRNLATEAANGGGVSGATLSAVAGGMEGAPPISYLLAAWVATYPSPSAGFARALLGTQDFKRAEEILFPRVLLTLFTADALAAGEHGFVAKPAGFMRATVADGPCTAASSFIQNGIAAVAKALKVDTSGGGILGFLGQIWNVAVDLAAGLVRGLVNAFKTLVLTPLIDAFAVLAVISEITSYLVEWRVVVRGTPEDNRFGVGSEVVTGRVEAHVTDNQLPVPAIIRDCSKVFGVDLSKIGSAEGSSVEWTTFAQTRADLAVKTRADTALDAKRSGWLDYRTGQEPADLAERGEAVTAQFKVTALIRREDVKKLEEMLKQLIYGALPDAIAGVVRDLAGKVINAATARLREIIYDLKASRLIGIAFHTDPGKAPKPGTVASCEPGRVAPGHYRGGDAMDFTAGEIKAHYDWQLDVQVDDRGGLTGTLLGPGTTTSPYANAKLLATYQVTGSLAAPELSLVSMQTGDQIIRGEPGSVTFPPMVGGCDGLVWDFEWRELAGGITGVTGDLRLSIKAGKVS